MLLWYVAFIQNAEVGGVGARDEAGGLRGEGVDAESPGGAGRMLGFLSGARGLLANGR
jgi:hypothetical protein